MVVSNGSLPPRATIRDIASAAGVSKATVSRVLNGGLTSVRISPATQTRVRQVAAELDYQPLAAARALGLQRTDQVAVVIPAAGGAEHEYHRFSHLKISELLSGIDRATAARGYNVLLQITAGDPFADPRHANVWKRRAVDGIIWFAQPLAAQLARLPAPVVAINVAPTATPGVSTVNADNYTGSRFAVEHLLRLGHRRVAHVAGPAQSWNAAERARAYLDVTREAGLEPVVEQADVFESGGAAAMARLLRRTAPPTAVFACGDLVAIGAISTLRGQGVRVPEDVAVIGSDGVEFGRYLTPSLSTVGMRMFETASHAAELLLDLVHGALDGVHHVTTPTDFVVGRSCGYRLTQPDAPFQVRTDGSQPLAYGGGHA